MEDFQICISTFKIFPETRKVAFYKRSGSTLRRTKNKNWFRSIMKQERFNHYMLLSKHKDKIDLSSLVQIVYEFSEAKNERLCIFCPFNKSDYVVYTIAHKGSGVLRPPKHII